jgi:hypothetical protein
VLRFHANGGEQLVAGESALRMAGTLLPAINYSGGNKTAVEYAVKAIEARGGPESFLAREIPVRNLHIRTDRQSIARLGTPVRLALEMALHEEAERRAIEGELAALEAQWREAEEIAAIADNLFLPSAVEQQLDELKRAEQDRRAPGEPPQP